MERENKMRCLNCGKDMVKNYRVLRMPDTECISYRGVENAICYRCWKCGTVQVDNIWYVPEEYIPSRGQEEEVNGIYDELHYPVPFPNKQNFQKYINQNTHAYKLALREKKANEGENND